MIQHQTSAKPALSSLVMASSSQFYAVEPDADTFRTNLKRKQSDLEADGDKSDKSALDGVDFGKSEPVTFYKSPSVTSYESNTLLSHQTMPSYPWMKEPRLMYSTDANSPTGLKLPIINGYSNITANLSSGSVSSSSPNDSINTPTTAVKTSKSFFSNLKVIKSKANR